MYTGERQVSTLRKKYLEAVLKQDVGFFDTDARTGDIVFSVSTDTLLVQDAISEKVKFASLGFLIHCITHFPSPSGSRCVFFSEIYHLFHPLFFNSFHVFIVTKSSDGLVLNLQMLNLGSSTGIHSNGVVGYSHYNVGVCLWTLDQILSVLLTAHVSRP